MPIRTSWPARCCADHRRGTNFWPASYSRKTSLLYIPTFEGCRPCRAGRRRACEGQIHGRHRRPDGLVTGGLVMFDPVAGEVKKRVDLPYPNAAGVLSTAGGIVVTAMIDAPSSPMTTRPWTSCGGSMSARLQRPADDLCGERQAIHRHRVGPVLRRPRRAPPRNTRSQVTRNPELRLQGNATMVYVFGL